jgi:hypothetical protein
VLKRHLVRWLPQLDAVPFGIGDPRELAECTLFAASVDEAILG